MSETRKAGVLMPVASLPSEYGAGILVKVRMHLLIASIRWDLGYGRFCH